MSSNKYRIPLNLNTERWDLLSSSTPSNHTESDTFNQDITSTLESISNTNYHSAELCDLNDHEYTS